MKSLLNEQIKVQGKANDIIGKISEAVDRLREEGKKIDMARDQNIQTVETALNHIISRAQKLLKDKENVAGSLNPALKEMRDANMRMTLTYNGRLLYLKYLLKNNLTSLSLFDPIRLPSEDSTPVTILRLDQPTLDRGVREVARLYHWMDTNHYLLHGEKLNRLPEDFDTCPKQTLLGLYSSLYPLLTDTLRKEKSIIAPVWPMPPMTPCEELSSHTECFSPSGHSSTQPGEASELSSPKDLTTLSPPPSPEPEQALLTL